MPNTGDGSSLPRDDWSLEVRPGVQVTDGTAVLLPGAASNSGLVQPGPAGERLTDPGQTSMPRRLPNTGEGAVSTPLGLLAALALVLLAGAWRLRHGSRA
jgi:LPXTG-motif cell wall-anchored protein